jgi:hypothetical protein
MAKPFSIQSPEDIAKEYAGNKQKIAQAMQMGVVDPTAGVLAGMFIDRMRGAQAQEGANPPTVAQQVMGGAPPAPAPPLPAGGLGGTSPAGAPSMAPPMGAPPQMPMPEAPPMGMADGGLAMLPVPDAMFDEPDNGGYAGGGIVAFSPGGEVDLERLRRAILMQESGGDYGVTNREGSGAMGAYQFMPDTARALAKRAGLEYRPDLMSGKGGRSKEGIEYQERLMDEQMKDILAFSGGDVGRAGIYHFAGPNEKLWGPKTRKYEQDILRRYSGGKDTGEVPERDLGTAEGRGASLLDALKFGRSAMEGMPREELERARTYALEELDPAKQEEARKADMWQALAEMGFRMASSNSPFLLQAIGEAATATLPGVQASKKERKAAKDNAIRTLMAIEDVDRKTATAGVEIGVQAYKAGIDQEQFEQQMAFREKELASLEARTKEELSLKREALSAQKNQGTQFDRILGAYAAANPGLNEFQLLALMRKDGLIGGSGAATYPGEAAGEAQGNDDIVVVGSRPAQ